MTLIGVALLSFAFGMVLMALLAAAGHEDERRGWK